MAYEYELETRGVKLDSFFDYFNGNVRKNKVDRNDRTYKLERMMEIYNSSMLELEKLLQMSQVYKSSEMFLRAFRDLEKVADDEFFGHYLEIIKEIYEFYRVREEQDLIRVAKELKQVEESKYMEDFSGACQLVESYLAYEDSPFLSEFVKVYGINESAFLRCVNIIHDLDEDELYKKFLEKYERNVKEVKAMTLNKVNNLRSGAITGLLPNGEEFTRIEAYKNLPFYDEHTANEVIGYFNVPNSSSVTRKLKNLAGALIPEDKDKVLKYIYENEILGNGNPTILKEEEIYSTKIIYEDKEMTDADKTAIINYMKEEKMPPLLRAFNEVRNAYYGGKLQLQVPKKLEKVGK